MISIEEKEKTSVLRSIFDDDDVGKDEVWKAWRGRWKKKLKTRCVQRITTYNEEINLKINEDHFILSNQDGMEEDTRSWTEIRETEAKNQETTLELTGGHKLTKRVFL